jgi:Mg2+ and Co2+ transporter CorA
VEVELNTSATEPIIEQIEPIIEQIEPIIEKIEPIIEQIDQSITAQNIILNEIQNPTGLIENVMGIMNGIGSVA